MTIVLPFSGKFSGLLQLQKYKAKNIQIGKKTQIKMVQQVSGGVLLNLNILWNAIYSLEKDAKHTI